MLICLVLALSSCGAVTSAYVQQNGSGGYELVMPPQCDYTIQSVVVKYYGDEDDLPGFDDLETVWEAEAEGEGRKAVTLLQENDGYASEWITDGIDADARVVIGWTELRPDGDEFNDSLDGTLADVIEGDVLWYDGLTSRDEYDRATTAPWSGFRC